MQKWVEKARRKSVNMIDCQHDSVGSKACFLAVSFNAIQFNPILCFLSDTCLDSGFIGAETSCFYVLPS